MGGDQMLGMALSEISSNPERARDASFEALRAYSSELVFATRPSQRQLIRANMERCIEIARSSVQAESAGEAGFVPVKSDVKFDDVIGLDEIKQMLREDLVEFDCMKGLPGLKRPKGMILYGPPGCGKTMLGKALAGELGLDFYYISCADVLSKFYGESARIIKTLFSTARRRRSVIFIDEFEELALRKDSGSHEATRKIVNQLLVELDGIGGNENVYTIGATNAPYAIDPSILRRLRPVYVPVPDSASRSRLVSRLAAGHDVDPEYVARLTESKEVGSVMHFYSFDDMVELVGRASRLKWRRTRDSSLMLTTEDVEEAYRAFSPSINEFDMRKYSTLASST